MRNIHPANRRKKAKNRMLGNIRFIGELYKSKMLTEKIMHECVIKLLGDVKNPDLDEVECLVKLLTAIGKMIDHPKSKEYMDAYFTRIRDMSLHSELPNRTSARR
jgi:translation initiation factor 4G